MATKRQLVHAGPLTNAEHQADGDADDPEHRVESQEQQQPEKNTGHRREEPIAVDMRPRVGQQRGEEQRLHHDFGVRVAAQTRP